MFQSQRPDLEDLPTSRQLLRSTLLAIVVAGVLLVTVVMPAEYAVDPTGIGRLLGLTQMGEIKNQLAEEAALDEASSAATPPAAPTLDASTPAAAAVAAEPTPTTADRSDTMEVTLAPGEGAEIKVRALTGAKIEFAWTVEGGHVNFDTHGDPVPKPRGFYHGYGKGKASRGESGNLVAAFDGLHGWFWRNRSEQTVKVLLQVSGPYSEIKRVL